MAQYVTFRLDEAPYGIEVNKVTEILCGEDTAGVSLSPEAITGSVNLCDQIATLIDPHKQLMLPPQGNKKTTIMVVAVLDEETLSLIVDSIGNVHEVDEDDFEVPPDILSQETRELVLGVYKPPDGLLLVLGVGRVVVIRQDTCDLEKVKETTAV